MKKYLNKIISLNYLIKSPSIEQVNHLYTQLMEENSNILKETHQFFQKGDIYYNLNKAEIVNIIEEGNDLKITISTNTFENGVALGKKPIVLKIHTKEKKKLDIEIGCIITMAVVHNNQIGFVYHKNEKLSNDIIDFKTIELNDKICFSKRNRYK